MSKPTGASILVGCQRCPSARGTAEVPRFGGVAESTSDLSYVYAADAGLVVLE
jgi:hypothetical protein